MYQDNEFITAVDLSFAGILQSTKKAKSALQPVFESFTNSLEAIRIRQQNAEAFRPAIRIRIDANKTTLEDSTEFDSLTITDNGIGFNDAEFRRFNTYKLANKGFKNLGSGRIQFVHYFDTATVKSIYAENGRFFERHFVVSKKAQFLERNAIVKHISNRDVESLETGTTIVFRHLLEKSGVYDDLDHNSLKARLLERYSHYFCNRKNELPEITIEFYVASEHLGTSSITPDDIPDPDKTETINLKYSKKNGNLVETTEKTEEFLIQAFKLPEAVLKDNRLALVSKGEVIEDSPVFLESLAEGDVLGGNKYLFLVAGDYIDARDTDVRGTLNIPDKESFSKGLYGDEEILLDDIQSSVNDSIRTMYPEIDQAREQHLKSFQELKEMFLLDDETAKDINISINDNERKILEKFYEAEAKKSAAIDASIKESIDELENLDPRSNDYGHELEKQIEKLTRQIPLQNRKALTHYVARRKLVLELLDKILERKLKVQDSARKDDEALIHNLLFQKGSANSNTSDLWMLSEDFIYFEGSSNKDLDKIEIGGERLFGKMFSEEEERYLNSLGENRRIKKPDVLLFPEEGKCLIIEFKAPDVNVSDHLTQIDKYAGLIRNYTNPKFQITMFYGFLIGENIEERDVLGAVSSFEHSYQFDYLFRPSTRVIGFGDRSNGSIYTEVIKYSTLLARARQRNSIFIDKLK